MSFVTEMINNIYQPTEDERNKLKINNGFLKVSGDKVFATLQGEGLLKEEGGTAGCSAVFLRLQFCNLHCGLNKGWKCDTGYTWDVRREEYWKEPEDWSIIKAKEEIEKAWLEKFPDRDQTEKRAVITGGEPLLQQDKIISLMEAMPDWSFEIETNGTIIPELKLINCQINCSPKLKNSGNEKQLRFKSKVLRAINNWPISWFKFVVNGVDDFKEIKEIVDFCELNPKKILIMPEGYTLEAVNGNLAKVKDLVVNEGWLITNRNQLLWFGTKRRT
jgi:7-carboxy-7-deazaguanine synthase